MAPNSGALLFRCSPLMHLQHFSSLFPLSRELIQWRSQEPHHFSKISLPESSMDSEVPSFSTADRCCQFIFCFLFVFLFKSLSNTPQSLSQFGSGRVLALTLPLISRKSELLPLSTTVTRRRHWPFRSARFWFYEHIGIVSYLRFCFLIWAL